MAYYEVGPGKPYSNVMDAISDASNGDTIFVYPGSYTDVDIYKWVNIKGVDNSVSSVYFGGTTRFFLSGDCPGNGKIYIEGFTAAGFSFSYTDNDSNGEIVFNRLYVPGTGHLYTFCFTQFSVDCVNLKLTMKNLLMGNTYSEFNFGNSNYDLIRVLYPDPSNWNTKPRHNNDAIIASFGSGYGPDYGTYYLSMGPNGSCIPQINIEDDYIVVETDSYDSYTTIYYTMDGSDPDQGSNEYIEPIPISYSFPFRVIAYQNEKDYSSGSIGTLVKKNGYFIVPDHIPNISNALIHAEEEDTILLQPGSYTEQGIVINKWINIKGMSVNPNDVRIYAGMFRWMFELTDSCPSGKIYFEGVRFIDDGYWHKGSFNFDTCPVSAAGEIIINRCNFSGYGVGINHRSRVVDLKIILQNINCLCSWVVASFSGKYDLLKSYVNEPVAYSSVQPQTDDHVTAPTEGYGYNYGEWYLDFGGFDFSTIDNKILLLGDTWENVTDSRILTSPPASNATEFEEEII